MKKLYLVDVSSMFFRAFYAIPPLRTSKGLPTNALYGFLAMCIKLIRENRPDYMVFCFDRKEPSFRAELYQDYKANRSEMPEDLEPQLPYIRDITSKLGVLALDKENYEADDIIGSLAAWGAKQNLDVSIVSGDKDFAQLVNERITLYDTMKDVRINPAGVVEKWGVEPTQMIDYLAIVGDSSDNIPGVKGVGPKGAQKLLAEFKTLDEIYKHVDEMKSESLKNKLLESKEAAYLAKKLVTIVTDLDLKVQIDDMKLKPIDKDSLKSLLDELEFGGFHRKLFGEENSTGENTKKSKPVENQAVFNSKAQAVRVSVDRVQWDLAQLKKNINPYDEIWVAMNERGVCFGYDGQAIQVDAHLEEVGQILSSKLLAWKGFDLKSVWHSLKMPQVQTPKWDSMLAAYVVKAGPIESFSQVYEKYCNKKLPELCAPEDVLHAEIELESVLRSQLEVMRGARVLEKFELPLVPVLYDMETRGILIDKKRLSDQSAELGKDIARLEKQIHSAAGESFNIASPKQLGAVLFEKLKLPVSKKTKTGYSTDSDVLSKLAAQYPICELVIEYRELAKLKSTYVDALPSLIDARDGRLHTHFHQAVTQTGRLSSSNPNLQNIPIRTERGRAIREAFIAKEGHVLLSVDYSQIELRVLAEITGDPGLCEAFQKDLDIHAATASEVFGVALDEVTPDQRRIAKAVNFGIAYGQGVYGLAESLEISRDESKKIIENYFKKFSKVKEYMLDTVAIAKEQGYVESLFGRRRYMDEFKSPSSMVQKFGERAAINAPIQGTSSDLMKKAMIDVAENVSAPMLLQVHDELLFECPEEQVESESLQIKKIMEAVAPFKIPLRVHVSWDKTW
jgi:DNA polymerase-1